MAYYGDDGFDDDDGLGRAGRYGAAGGIAAYDDDDLRLGGTTGGAFDYNDDATLSRRTAQLDDFADDYPAGRGIGLGGGLGGYDDDIGLDSGLHNLSLDGASGLDDAYGRYGDTYDRDPFGKVQDDFAFDDANDATFAIPEADSSYLGSPLVRDGGFLGGSGGLSDSYYDSGLDSLGTAGSHLLNDQYDDLDSAALGGALGGSLASTSGYDSAFDLDAPLPGLSALAGSSYDLDAGLDYDDPSNSSLGGLQDYASGMGSGWETYDNDLDRLGSSFSSRYNDLSDDLAALDKSELLEDAAIGLGGAAVGAGLAAAAMHSYDKHHLSSDLGAGGVLDRDYALDPSSGLSDYGSSRLTGLDADGYSAGAGLGHSSDYHSSYGNALLDNDLGLLGSSSFGYGAYDGFNSGMSNLDLQYASLANYENQLLNSQYSQAERDNLLRDRMAFESLDDAARRSTWNSYSPGMRDRLGLNSGYWGSQLGGRAYDPSYDAWGYSTGGLGGGVYYGTGYSAGYGDPSFYSNNFSSFGRSSYHLTPSVGSYYSDYLGPSATYTSSDLPYFSDDLRFRGAADLAYYQQVLNNDRALDEAERMRRWQQRLNWERLDNDARLLRWKEMKEAEREQLGLAAFGSYYGGLYAGSGHGLSLAYELPTTLRSTFQPYIAGRAPAAYIDPNYVRYSELAAYSNALKYDRALEESERLRRWKQRLLFEQLDEMERRNRWKSMPYVERAALGLAGGFYDARWGVSSILDPSALRPMKYPVSSRLASVYRPYKSKQRLLANLRAGAEDAIAFAELAAFENALRADARLREEDKLRRWKARVRWQELNERERRRRFYMMQESERRMLGLGLSSYWGRRYAAPLMLNGTKGLPPPRRTLPRMRQPLPPALQERFRPVLASQVRRQPPLATSSLSRSLVGPDPVKDLANRIRLSIAQKKEQMPGASTAARLAATEEKRRILREMDADRRANTAIQVTEEERMRRLRQLGR